MCVLVSYGESISKHIDLYENNHFKRSKTGIWGSEKSCFHIYLLPYAASCSGPAESNVIGGKLA